MQLATSSYLELISTLVSFFARCVPYKIQYVPAQYNVRCVDVHKLMKLVMFQIRGSFWFYAKVCGIHSVDL